MAFWKIWMFQLVEKLKNSYKQPMYRVARPVISQLDNLNYQPIVIATSQTMWSFLLANITNYIVIYLIIKWYKLYVITYKQEKRHLKCLFYDAKLNKY